MSCHGGDVSARDHSIVVTDLFFIYKSFTAQFWREDAALEDPSYRNFDLRNHCLICGEISFFILVGNRRLHFHVLIHLLNLDFPSPHK